MASSLWRSSKWTINRKTGRIDVLAYDLRLPCGLARVIYKSADGWRCCATHQEFTTAENAMRAAEADAVAWLEATIQEIQRGDPS